MTETKTPTTDAVVETTKPTHPPATVGRDVHYFEGGYEGGKAPLAAKVIRVEHNEKTLESIRRIFKDPDITEVCSLVVFHPKWHGAGGQVANVPRSSDGTAKPGYWIWPPRV